MCPILSQNVKKILNNKKKYSTCRFSEQTIGEATWATPKLENQISDSFWFESISNKIEWCLCDKPIIERLTKACDNTYPLWDLANENPFLNNAVQLKNRLKKKPACLSLATSSASAIFLTSFVILRTELPHVRDIVWQS